MASVLAAVGLILVGFLGGACGMLFLGFRRPSVHQRELQREIRAALTGVRSELVAIRHDLSPDQVRSAGAGSE